MRSGTWYSIASLLVDERGTRFTNTLRADRLARVYRALSRLEADALRLDRVRRRFS